MPWYSILTFLFGSGILITAWGYIFARLKKSKEETKALRLGVQALLRNNLLDKYNEHLEKGYAPIYARENFENMWTQYHNLGENGVMDDVHVKFMMLPTERNDLNE